MAVVDDDAVAAGDSVAVAVVVAAAAAAAAAVAVAAVAVALFVEVVAAEELVVADIIDAAPATGYCVLLGDERRALFDC